MTTFSHLHVHTQYSLLDGAADIKRLIKKAKADGIQADRDREALNQYKQAAEVLAKAVEQLSRPRERVAERDEQGNIIKAIDRPI